LFANESVGLEVKDDVHTDLSNNHKILYQLAYTIKKNPGGSIANLTTSDLDQENILKLVEGYQR
jgi:hypothetical protein